MSTTDGQPFPPDLAGVSADDDVLWAIFSQSRNPMLLADDDRRYINANAAACELLGYDIATLRTMSVDDITIPEYRPYLDDVWQDFLGRGGTVGRFAVLCADGSRAEVEFNATANVAPGLHLSIFISPDVSGDAKGREDDNGADKNFEEPVQAVTARTGTVLDATERRVLTLLAMGRNWFEVADEVGEAPGQVRVAMESAMAKLGARTRAHAVSIAIRAGEIDPPDAPQS